MALDFSTSFKESEESVVSSDYFRATFFYDPRHCKPGYLVVFIPKTEQRRLMAQFSEDTEYKEMLRKVGAYYEDPLPEHV